MQLAQRLRSLFSGPAAAVFEADDELMKAILHPDAHEEGGLACNDKQLLLEMRECIMQWIKSMGRQILKGNLNLVNTSFPVSMFEPRSYLQKLADIWAYPDYINSAAAQTDPLERMKLLVAWMVAGLHHSVEAWRKPFNPILGETWQANMPGGICLYMEQISHHPPCSAYQLEGPSWKLHGWSQPAVVPVVKFYGIKTVAKGARQIDFADGSTVHMSMPHFAIKGVVYAAKPHAEVLGVARLLDEAHHLEAVINFGAVPGTRQRMLARADAVCGEIYQLPRAAHLQGAHQHASGALQRSSTSVVALQDLEEDTEQPSLADSSSHDPDSDDEAIFNDFHATHISDAAAAAAAAAAAGSGRGSSGGGDKPPKPLRGRSSSSSQLQAQPCAPEVLQHQQQRASAISSSRVSAPGGPQSRQPVHRSRSAVYRSSSAPGHRPEGGGTEGGVVPGVAVARIEGCWLSHLNIDNHRYWTLTEAQPQRWRVDEAPLPSDLRFRQDLAAVASGDQAGAQHWKEVLEQQQRADRKLREAAGVFEH